MNFCRSWIIRFIFLILSRRRRKLGRSLLDTRRSGDAVSSRAPRQGAAAPHHHPPGPGHGHAPPRGQGHAPAQDLAPGPGTGQLNKNNTGIVSICAIKKKNILLKFVNEVPFVYGHWTNAKKTKGIFMPEIFFVVKNSFFLLNFHFSFLK